MMLKKIPFPLNNEVTHIDLYKSEIFLQKNTTGNLELSRDFISVIPVFYCIDNNELIVSPSFLEIDNYLSITGYDCSNDVDYIKSYIAFQAPDTSRTIRSNIRVLRPGEIAVIRIESINSRFNYPDMPDRITKFSKEECVALLEEILGNLDVKNTGFHISSGLDSTLLAIISTKLFGKGCLNLATYKTKGSRGSEELEFANKLANDIGANYVVYDFTEINVFEEGRELIKRCLGYPIAHPSHLLEFMLDKSMVSSGFRCIVNGKGPDDCLGGYPWHLDQYCDPDLHLSRLIVTDIAELNSLVGITLSPNDAWEYWAGNSKTLSLASRLAFDSRRLTEAWNIIHSAISLYLDVDIASPFMDPQLRRGMFSLPGDQKVFQDKQKIFLRETFTEYYPSYLLDLPKKGMNFDLRPYFLEYSRDELYSNIVPDERMASGYFQLETIKHWIDLTLSGEKNFGWQLWSVFCLCNSLSD